MDMEPWKLKKSANCFKCGDATIHQIEVDTYNLRIICKECGFTRFYKFHMVELPETCD